MKFPKHFKKNPLFCASFRVTTKIMNTLIWNQIAEIDGVSCTFHRKTGAGTWVWCWAQRAASRAICFRGHTHRREWGPTLPTWYFHNREFWTKLRWRSVTLSRTFFRMKCWGFQYFLFCWFFWDEGTLCGLRKYPWKTTEGRERRMAARMGKGGDENWDESMKDAKSGMGSLRYRGQTGGGSYIYFEMFTGAFDL